MCIRIMMLPESGKVEFSGSNVQGAIYRHSLCYKTVLSRVIGILAPCILHSVYYRARGSTQSFASIRLSQSQGHTFT